MVGNCIVVVIHLQCAIIHFMMPKVGTNCWRGIRTQVAMHPIPLTIWLQVLASWMPMKLVYCWKCKSSLMMMANISEVNSNTLLYDHAHIQNWHNVTLRATLYRNSNPYSPSTHVRFQDPYFVSITFLFSILTLNLDSIFETPYTQPVPPCSMPVPIYHGQGFCNPVSDLLIPLLCSQPCIVSSSYKSESPMYHRPSSNIKVTPLSSKSLSCPVWGRRCWRSHNNRLLKDRS